MANAEPYEFLELFLDEAFWELLTVETNQYMALKKVLSEAQEKHLQALGDVTMPEIKKYFAIYFAMGIVPQCNLKDYWQAKNVITQTPAFHEVRSRNHWYAIWNHLHFSDNAKTLSGGAPGYDRLFKIRQLIKQPGYIGQKGMVNAEPYEFLELFLDEAFWELLTVETNQYMALKKVLSEAQEKHLQALGDVTMPEIKKYFAIYFAMGIVPQCNLKDYWQAKNVITQTPAFHAVFHIQPGTCNKVLIV